VHTHLKIVAVLFLVMGATFAIGAALAGLVFVGIAAAVGASLDEGSTIASWLLNMTGAALGALLAALSLPSLLCGWGLLKRRRWARILGIILAALSLLRVPVGTLFGAYALWVLLSRQTEELFGD
jgi:hypothetical protein